MKHLITSLLTLCSLSTFATEFTFKEHSYKSASFTVDQPFSQVKERLLSGLADYTAADAYARYDKGELPAGPPAKSTTASIRKPYKVYDVRWEVPIFVDTGKAKEVYRIGLGGGPGRHLIGEHPESGLHLLPAIHLWGEGQQTTVFFILPSSQYANAFPDSTELGRQADARLMSLLETLKD